MSTNNIKPPTRSPKLSRAPTELIMTYSCPAMSPLYPRPRSACPAKELSVRLSVQSLGMNMAFYSLSYLELMSPENRKWKVHKGWLGGFVVVLGTQHPRAATTFYTLKALSS